MSFTHLQIRSGYSLMNSTITIDKLVEQAKKLQFDALALTDESVLYGAIPFYKACKKAGIQPIIGMVIHVASTNIKEPCIVLAKNNTGYEQLIALSTKIQTKEEKTITKEELMEFTGGLIGILPVFGSSFAEPLLTPDFKKVEEMLNIWTAIFEENSFYLGVQDHGIGTEYRLNQMVKHYQDAYPCMAVAIQDVRYLDNTGIKAFSCFQTMAKGEKWKSQYIREEDRNKYLRSSTEMEQLFSDWPEVLLETKHIQEQCQVEIDFSTRKLPSYPVPDEEDSTSYLRRLCEEQLQQKYPIITDFVRKRFEKELKTIDSMGYSDYFLIVWDFIKYAKGKNIFVGPGRGSSAGSLIAYILDITEVDPLEHHLLFERFLNPERISMPDIDVDFSDHRRDEVIDYVRNKYGYDHVAQIITFGTFAPRSLIRELLKTLGIDSHDAAFILQYIPLQNRQSLRKIIGESSELKEAIRQSPSIKLLFSIAVKLEGLPRHISTHAAGVVISDEPLTNHVPLTIGTNETSLTQYAMDQLEAIGLLKFDFLGLRNLSVLEQIVNSIAQVENQSISLKDIPIDDKKTFQILQKGLTNGVFQLESQGMKQVLKNLKPTAFSDIVAVNALYRPGPMDFIPTYIKRKHGEEKTVYPHTDLQSILKETYGVLIYQEQIMQIAHQIAGFTLGEADILRRAVSKKKEELIQSQKEKFIHGCMANGYTKEIGEKLFAWIVRFSNYGFPKSHAVAYSKISYQLAYLKAHYPASFFAEVLSTIGNQQEKLLPYIKEMKSFQLQILPPSINHSFTNYTVENGNIRMGLLAIKGIGIQTIKEIIQTRKGIPFKGLFDFCLRIPNKILKRSLLETLIMAGAFDEIHANRASLLATIDKAIVQGELFKEFREQPSLFPEQMKAAEEYVNMEDFSPFKKLSDEKELLGMYVSEHPFKKVRPQLANKGYITLQETPKFIGNRQMKTIAIAQAIKKIRTKRGDPMAFLTIADETEEMDAVLFPDMYREINRWLREESVLDITGKIEQRNNQLQWIINKAEPVSKDELIQTYSSRLFIKWRKDVDEEKAAQFIRKIAKKYPGDATVLIYHERKQKTYQLKYVFLNPTDACLSELKSNFGDKAVVLMSK